MLRHLHKKNTMSLINGMNKNKKTKNPDENNEKLLLKFYSRVNHIQISTFCTISQSIERRAAIGKLIKNCYAFDDNECIFIFSLLSASNVHETLRTAHYRKQ